MNEAKDCVNAVKWLQTLPYVDSTRIAHWGACSCSGSPKRPWHTCAHLRSFVPAWSCCLAAVGWSFGGFLASMINGEGAGVLKSIIAVAPVADWRLCEFYHEQQQRLS